jgi:hypothetical protein
LKLRDAHTIITAVGIGHKLGAVDQISERNYKEGAECKVVGRDPHSVHLFKVGSMVNYSVFLDHVQISYDHVKHRPMLVITGY